MLAGLERAKPTTGEIRGFEAALWLDPCAYCGGRMEVLDHIEPRVRGGGEGWENLTAACSVCNQRKGGRSLLGHLGGLTAAPALVRAKAQIAGWYRL